MPSIFAEFSIQVTRSYRFRKMFSTSSAQHSLISAGICPAFAEFSRYLPSMFAEFGTLLSIR